MREEIKVGVQVRKEKRREKKKEKNMKRQQSWIQNQKIKKLKKTEIKLEQKLADKLNVPVIDFSGKGDIEITDVDKDTVEKNQHQSWFENQKSSKLRKNATTSKQKVGKESDVSENRKPRTVPKAQLDLLGESVKKESKSLKRKPKTKFYEYLEMEKNKVKDSAEEDLRLERELAKRLKRGKSDASDKYMKTFVDFLVDGDGKRDKQRSSKKKNSAKAGEHQPDYVEAINSELDRDDFAAEIAPDEPSTKAPDEPSTRAPDLTESKKYIAPHLRSRTRNESEEHTQIRRRVRGLLNRLSESNVESITLEMSTIYKSIGRTSGSQIISEEVLASCTGGPRGNEQYAAVFAAFVAGMACSVGIDFSAKVIASLAKTFEDEYLKEDNLSLRNLTLLLSNLYIFGICSSDLIYDFISILSKRLMEIDVSTILTILQCCGMQLRSDDPSAMKDFILGVQHKVNELKSLSGSMPDDHLKMSNKRMEFMLETIFDIKNNKKKAKDDPTHYIRLKKWLQKLRVEDVILRDLKWSTLLDHDKKSQWWLSEDLASTTDKAEEVASTIDREVLEAQKLLQLAAAQRMNTDTRRAIFCIIMSGEDYVDAFEKLLRLDLPGKQDREIIRVLLKCCLQEKVFNKYYSVLTSKLCSHDKNHKFTLQYCLWDHYKELESMELIQSMNLAKFTAEMLASFSLSLAVLKTMDLSDIKRLTPKTIMHFRMLFEAVFELPESTVWNIFTRIALMPELETLRNDIEFFIKQYVVNNNKNISKKFKVAKKALSNLEGILMP